METGTGKTLVYLRSIYKLCREYGFTKFIILVPSVPIGEGVLDTIETFRPQLERLDNIPLHAFEYDSKKLTKVKRFIEGADLQVMVMTTHSFSADDNIINRPDRDDSPDGFSYARVWRQTARRRLLRPAEPFRCHAQARHLIPYRPRPLTTTPRRISSAMACWERESPSTR